MKKILAVVGGVVLLAGCASGPLTESPATLKTLKTLEKQQRVLESQNEQIENLLVTQTALVSNLDDMQMRMQKMQKNLDRSVKIQLAAEKQDVKTTPVREIVEQPKKPSLRHAGKAVVGRVEYAWLEGAGTYIKARIDTGEKASFLYVQNIQPFERNGDDWVRFELPAGENESVISMEAPLLREVKVRIVGKDEVKRRSVVKLRIRIGELDEPAEFTLSEQKDMIYPISLGRSFLQDIAIVDVGRKFTRKRDPKLTANPDY